MLHWYIHKLVINGSSLSINIKYTCYNVTPYKVPTWKVDVAHVIYCDKSIVNITTVNEHNMICGIHMMIYALVKANITSLCTVNCIVKFYTILDPRNQCFVEMNIDLTFIWQKFFVHTMTSYSSWSMPSSRNDISVYFIFVTLL